MDYQRFLELAARFFERAGTVLHKKSEHYSGAEGSPACILIDETRSTYYLTEIGLPPDIPEHDSFLQRAVSEYAAKNSLDTYTVSLLAALGESLNTSKFRPVDDPAADPLRLQQKGALIVAESAAASLTDYLQKSAVEFQSVPLKGVFTIYFFNKPACDAIDRLFEEISGAEKPQEEEQEQEEQDEGQDEGQEQQQEQQEEEKEQEQQQEEKQEQQEEKEEEDVISLPISPVMPENPEEKPVQTGEESSPADKPEDTPTPAYKTEEISDETQETAATEDELDSLLSKPYAGYSHMENEAFVNSTLTEEVDYPPFSSDKTAEEFSEVTEAARTELLQETETVTSAEQTRRKRAMESVYAPVPKTPLRRDNEPEDMAENTESFFYNVLKHIWSFIIFFPAYILLKATRGKVPPSIIYWISSICALFGVYYFPLAKGLAPLTETVKNAASANLNTTASVLSNLDPAVVFDGLMMPESLAGFVQGVANGAIALTFFDISLLSFMNSVYFLQYALTFAFLLTIFPVCRKFGKRMVCFFVTLYFFYIPLLFVGAEGIRLLVMIGAGSPVGAADSAAAAVCTAAVGSFVLALLIPAAACFFAAKVCKRDIDVL